MIYKQLISRFIALALLLVSIQSQAADYYVEVTNKTSFTMMYLYVSPESSSSWEEDVLGSDILSPGETTRVDITGYDSPVFDIRLEDEDGDTYTYYGVDVSRQDITVTLADLDVANGSNDYYVDVTNSTSYTMMYLYVSPADSNSWEEDVLGSDVLSPGETTRVTLTGYASPVFDIQLRDEDEDTYTFYGINVEREDLEVTIADLD